MDMNKVLVIGQALPFVKQQYPYDSTYWYEWLEELGVSKEQSLDLFTYDAVFGEFPGFSSSGGHLKPTLKQMDSYYEFKLKYLISYHNTIILLGGVSKEYLAGKLTDKTVYYIVHPSKRNTAFIKANWKNIITTIKKCI